MNKHEATELGIRLIAILNLTKLLSTLPYLLSIQDINLNLNTVAVLNPWITLLIILDLLVSMFLWFRANPIAQWMWHGSKENNEDTATTAIQLQAILFSAIGLYLLVSVIPNALQLFVYFAQKVATNPQLISLSDYANVIGFLVRILISAWLLFNASSIVVTLQRGKSYASKRKTA